MLELGDLSDSFWAKNSHFWVTKFFTTNFETVVESIKSEFITFGGLLAIVHDQVFPINPHLL